MPEKAAARKPWGSLFRGCRQRRYKTRDVAACLLGPAVGSCWAAVFSLAVGTASAPVRRSPAEAEALGCAAAPLRPGTNPSLWRPCSKLGRAPPARRSRAAARPRWPATDEAGSVSRLGEGQEKEGHGQMCGQQSPRLSLPPQRRAGGACCLPAMLLPWRDGFPLPPQQRSYWEVPAPQRQDSTYASCESDY